jgi:threonine dehydratase
MQSVFSFKLRGAYNKMAHLSPEQLAQGVIASSAGNHAQGVALGAKQLGTRAIIVMPTYAPVMKVNAVKARGGEVVLYGETYDDAYAHARQLSDEKGLTFVHPSMTGCDRGPGHHRHGDFAAAPSAHSRHLCGDRRRWIDLGHCRLREAAAA